MIEITFAIGFISGISVGIITTFLFISYSEKKYYDNRK